MAQNPRVSQPQSGPPSLRPASGRGLTPRAPPGSLAWLGLRSLGNQAQGCGPLSRWLAPWGLPASRLLRSQSRRARPARALAAGSRITVHWGTNLSVQNHSEEFQAPCEPPFTPSSMATERRRGRIRPPAASGWGCGGERSRARRKQSRLRRRRQSRCKVPALPGGRLGRRPLPT